MWSGAAKIYPAMPKQTFVCDFGDGLTCTTVINHTRIFQGKSHVMGMQWSRKPSVETLNRTLPQYREWLHSINQQVCEKSGKKLLYALQVGPSNNPDRQGGTWELWIYDRGQSPKLTQTVRGNP